MGYLDLFYFACQDAGIELPPPSSMRPAPPSDLVTTEDIQKCLEENHNLMQAILEYRNQGKVAECKQLEDQLQKNLFNLAVIAEAQSPPSGPPQVLPSSVAQQGINMQPPQGAMMQLPDQGAMMQEPPQGAMWQQPPQGAMMQQPPEGVMWQQPPEGAMWQQPPQGAMWQQPPQGAMMQQPPEGAMWQQPPEGAMWQQPPQGAMWQQPPQGAMMQQPPQGAMWQQPPQGRMMQQQQVGAGIPKVPKANASGSQVQQQQLHHFQQQQQIFGQMAMRARANKGMHGMNQILQHGFGTSGSSMDARGIKKDPPEAASAYGQRKKASGRRKQE